MSRIICAAALVAGIAISASSVIAQGKPGAAQDAPAAGAPVGLKVQLVLARYQGEKRISSMPYTLQLIANERETTSLRLGTEVPVASPGGGYNYRSVGTNIDCRAVAAGDGSYKLQITVNDTSIRVPEQKETAGAGSVAAAAPSFRSFTANFFILLRDGQTAQYTSASDPASGEVLKVDASLSVLK